MDTAIFDGWRYLRLESSQILSKTPREFSIIMRAQVERKYDDYEQMATMAMMTRQAYHAEKLKQSDVFKRPVDVDTAKKEADEIRDRTEYTMQWLSQFEEFSGKEGVITNE